MNAVHAPDKIRTTRPVVRHRRIPTGHRRRLPPAGSGYRDTMEPNVLKKSLAVLVSGAALFLTLGAGCQNEGGGENEDQPGVEQQDQQDQQDGDQGEQDGEQDGDN